VGGQGGGVWAPDVGVAAPGSSAVGGMEEQVGVACGGGIESWEGRQRKRRRERRSSILRLSSSSISLASS
jgi:hypothetical protein